MNPDPVTLLFVYNAASGLFNTLADMGHKLFSPHTYACSLCAITHGVFSEKADWRHFVEYLGLPCNFMHRDEFRKTYPSQKDALPAVFHQQGKQLHICISARELTQRKDLTTLQRLIQERCITPAPS